METQDGDTTSQGEEPEAGREGTRTIAPAYQRHGRLRSGGLRGNIQSSDGGLWPVYVSNQNMRPSTLDSYNSALRKWIQPFFADMHLEEITPRTVTDFMATCSRIFVGIL